MKRVFYVSLIISVFVLLFTVTSYADTYGDLTYNVTNGEATITDCNTSGTFVTIPGKINGYQVTSIGDDAFRSCTSLKSIVIPDGVTSIGSRAFLDCESLSSVTIPNSIESIGSSAFLRCYNLKEVHISDLESWLNIEFGESESSPLIRATNGLYINGEAIREITIPSGVTSIPANAFRNCTELTSVNFEEATELESIGNYAFCGCTNLGYVSIPSFVKSIGKGTFKGCTNLAEISVPFVGDAVDGSNTNFSYIFESVPSSLKKVVVTGGEKISFYGCSSIESITIPNTVTSIG